MKPTTDRWKVREREDNEPDLYTQLCQAASRGNTMTVKRLLAWGVGPDKPQFFRDPALLYAIGDSQTKTARLLIEAYGDVNADNDFGFTLLMSACRYGREQQTELVKLLLERGADVHAKDNHGYTALSYAMEEGNVECARLLLEAGAE